MFQITFRLNCSETSCSSCQFLKQITTFTGIHINCLLFGNLVVEGDMVKRHPVCISKAKQINVVDIEQKCLHSF
jgi:hypothetical protein